MCVCIFIHIFYKYIQIDHTLRTTGLETKERRLNPMLGRWWHHIEYIIWCYVLSSTRYLEHYPTSLSSFWEEIREIVEHLYVDESGQEKEKTDATGERGENCLWISERRWFLCIHGRVSSDFQHIIASLSISLFAPTTALTLFLSRSLISSTLLIQCPVQC